MEFKSCCLLCHKINIDNLNHVIISQSLIFKGTPSINGDIPKSQSSQPVVNDNNQNNRKRSEVRSVRSNEPMKSNRVEDARSNGREGRRGNISMRLLPP